MPGLGFLLILFVDDHLFDFVKLVDAENAFGVLAVRADFPAEAGRDANQFYRQVCYIQNLAGMESSQGNFGGADEFFPVLGRIMVLNPSGEITGPKKSGVIDHPGDGQGSKTLFDHVSESVIQKPVFEKDQFVFGEKTAETADLDAPVGIN